jgi:hypothetical protein
MQGRTADPRHGRALHPHPTGHRTGGPHPTPPCYGYMLVLCVSACVRVLIDHLVRARIVLPPDHGRLIHFEEAEASG